MVKEKNHEYDRSLSDFTRKMMEEHVGCRKEEIEDDVMSNKYVVNPIVPKCSMTAES